MKDLFQLGAIIHFARNTTLRERSWDCMKSHSDSPRLKKKRTRNILSAIVNDSPRILYYDNKRRRPLRKASSRYCVGATHTSWCCLGSSLYLYFPYSGGHLATQWKNSEEGREAGGGWKRYGEASVDSPCQTNDSFRAGKSPDSPSPAFVALFLAIPLGIRACHRKFIALAKYYIRAFPRSFLKPPSWDTGENFLLHITVLLLSAKRGGGGNYTLHGK